MTSISRSAPALRPLGRPKRKRRIPPLRLLLPAALIGALMLVPILYLVLRAASAGERSWEMLLRDRTLEIFANSALLALAATVCSLLLALPLAWLTTRTDLPLRRFWTVVTALPLVVPSYIGAFTIVAALGPRGILQKALAPLGVERLPEIYGFPGALMTLTLFSYPYVLLSLQAGLRGLDPTLEEASRSLGQSSWRTFWRITLPQLRPSIAAGGLLVMLYALSDFGAVSLMQFNSFTRAIYVQYQAAFNRGFAAVLSLALVALTVVLLGAEGRARGRARYYRSTGGCARVPRTVKLGRWRWPALIFCSVVALLALALPIGVIVYWLLEGLINGETLAPVWQAALSSISVSLGAAVVSLVAALPFAVLSVRFPGWMSRWLERSTYVSHALPGIVIALALVFLSINVIYPAYQSYWLLIGGYVVLFLPQAVGALRSSLLQVTPRIEEAGRSLGRSPAQVLRTITLPMVRPGVLAAAALVFLTTMKELPVTLLLSPIEFQTLATRIWSASSESFWARAAAPALVLVLISSLPMALLTLGHERRDP